jgi:hypothetical protein
MFARDHLLFAASWAIVVASGQAEGSVGGNGTFFSSLEHVNVSALSNETSLPAGAEQEVSTILNETLLQPEAAWQECRDEGGICGGPGRLPRPCCGSLRCETLLGGDGERRCASRQECVPLGQVCGQNSQESQSCCGAGTCKSLLGGDGTMKCVEQQQPTCVAVGAECGGPGRLKQACCSGQCEQLLGGSVMKCVQQPTCVARGEGCGGPGRLTQPCCSGQCLKRDPWNSFSIMACL